METKSGELLSAAITTSVGGVVLCTGTTATNILNAAGVLPQWAILAVLTGIICFFSAVFNADSLRALARFMSGCVWGTVVLICLYEQSTQGLLAMAACLLAFDFLTMLRGKTWTKYRSSRVVNY